MLKNRVEYVLVENVTRNVTIVRLCEETTCWQSSINYLGVCLLSGKSLTIDICASKRKFYMSCNCILSNSSNLCELVQLHLQQTYSPPILTCAIATIEISDKQLKELNASWNSVYRRIFKCHRWESVKLFKYGLGTLDFKHILMKLLTTFYLYTQLSNNLVVKQCFKLFKYSDEFIKFDCLSRWRENLSFYAVNSHVYEEFNLSVL